MGRKYRVYPIAKTGDSPGWAGTPNDDAVNVGKIVIQPAAPDTSTYDSAPAPSDERQLTCGDAEITHTATVIGATLWVNGQRMSGDATIRGTIRLTTGGNHESDNGSMFDQSLGITSAGWGSTVRDPLVVSGDDHSWDWTDFTAAQIYLYMGGSSGSGRVYDTYIEIETDEEEEGGGDSQLLLVRRKRILQ